MPTEIALIQTPVYETTGEPGPRVLHELCAFEVLSTLCHVRTNPEGNTLFLHVGHRDFAVSIVDLAATAALAVDGHLKGEIRARIIASRATPDPASAPAPGPALPVRGVVEGNGVIRMHPRRGH